MTAERGGGTGANPFEDPVTAARLEEIRKRTGAAAADMSAYPISAIRIARRMRSDEDLDAHLSDGCFIRDPDTEQPVMLYIRDHRFRAFAGHVDSEHSHRLHFMVCRTLREKRADGTFHRYYSTNLRRREQECRIETEHHGYAARMVRLGPCRNCLEIAPKAGTAVEPDRARYRPREISPEQLVTVWNAHTAIAAIERYDAECAAEGRPPSAAEFRNWAASRPAATG